MNTSKTLHYKDYSGTWHICFLHFYENYGVKGYTIPSTSPDVMKFLARRSIFLSKLDVPDQWYIPSIEPNARMLEQLIKDQAEVFELEVVAHWCEG